MSKQGVTPVISLPAIQLELPQVCSSSCRISLRLNHRSTLIILGDARGNYFDPRVDVFKHLSQRAKQVFWLNPEARDRWSDGDSDMRRYSAYCQRVDLCRELKDIERFADRLLTASR